jgi:glycosyltransferase involved in cell wall biosynthesis
MLFLGALRPYKGLEDLIQAFKDMPEDVRLLVAGVATPEYGRHIRSLCGPDPRIVARTELVPEDELQVYYAAADAVVLPFRRVLTSGSAVGAMSFGRAVIAPATGCLPELIDERSGILYQGSGPDALLTALRRALEVDLDAMGRAAQDRVQRNTWDQVGSVVAAAYRGE